MATTTGQIKAGSINVRLSGLTAGLIAAGLAATVAIAVIGQGGAALPQNDDVERALIEHRAGERAVLSAGTNDDVELALIEHRAGEK